MKVVFLKKFSKDIDDISNRNVRLKLAKEGMRGKVLQVLMMGIKHSK